MNLVSIPYHDWRKIEQEGARTRDAHFLFHLVQHPNVNKLLVINRPTTYLEIYLKKKKRDIEGKVILNHGGFSLYQVSEKLFVIDYISSDIIGQIIKKKKWFFDGFDNKKLLAFFKESIAFLSIDDFTIFTQNVFSSSFIKNLTDEKSVFDAWDNFLLFPDNKTIEEDLTGAYEDLRDHCNRWITNSKKNVDYFTEHFNVDNPELIRNGVDFEIFQKKYSKPSDLSNIPSPIIGFGGKISHLFDYDLYNHCIANHPDKNFVIVGQILDQEVFNRINKAPNFHYLGDKHYKQYPSYVCNFDIGIIPYVNNHLDSGADSIKAYEYLAAGLKAIGSKGAGMSDLSDYMHIAADKEEFSSLINFSISNPKSSELPNNHSWGYKTEQVLEVFKKLSNINAAI